MQFRLSKEWRCPRCGKLLARSTTVAVQIKCTRCGFVATFS